MPSSTADLAILGEDLNEKLQAELVYFTGIAKANNHSQEYIALLRKEIRLKYYSHINRNVFVKPAKKIKQEALARKEKDRKEKEEKARRENAIRARVRATDGQLKRSDPEFKRVPTLLLEDEECYENKLVCFGMACEVLPSNNPMQLHF
tara:strand:- start:934 stop:1380 length:447 start_codon:yes stop_codon:yes gene_type:complete